MIRFAVFFLVLFAILAAANRLVYRRAVDAFGLSRPARRALAALHVIGIVGLFAGRALLFALPSNIAAVFGGAGWVMQLAVILVAALLLVERLATWMAARALPPALPPAPLAERAEDAPAPAAKLTRREMITRAATGTAFALGGGTAGYGGLFARHDYVVEEVPIRLAELPRELDGFTIAQLSDIHFGLFVGDPEIRSAVELVRRARPNLIAITGDMIDSQAEFAPALGRLVRALSAIAPVAAIPGNHDYYAGVEEAIGAVEGGGGTVLLNRSMAIAEGHITLAGVDDLWARRFGPGRGPRLDAALRSAPEDRVRVLLAHQPVFFEEAAARVDLQLSGHTHGGQFNPGVSLAHLVLPHGWVAGRYQVGAAQLYVNRGFGTAGPPARLGSPPEVSRLVLTT
jgi:uncharacterized protein